jgi:glucosylglycerate phosphorylase
MTLQTISEEKSREILRHLQLLYGDEAAAVMNAIDQLARKYKDRQASPKPWVSENDVMLITYGDSLQQTNKAPLAVLKDFLDSHLDDVLTAVHLLPMFPFTSDDGFSVTDYRRINPELGDWEDVKALSNRYDLMFDAVVNHISKSSEWFQGYLQGDSRYANYFIEADPSKDYSKVTRPRALPLLTPFETAKGTKYIWTTFSEDQIDLNFSNPEVLLEILDLLVFYAFSGARFIRLDAIGFAWKKDGTTCMHLEETHAVVKLMRSVLDLVAPGTIMITETNVPHKDNISYFGNGHDEAQMVYQFPLPPLTLHAIQTGNARKLLDWADGLEPISPETTYFNFLASHDGIGVRPTEGILTDEERQTMAGKVLQHGGKVSFKNNSDGTTSPYELNITYVDALTHPDEPDDIRFRRFMASQAILLSVEGVPGIYIHSLLGSRNDLKGAEESGIPRRINREKLRLEPLVQALNDSSSLRGRIFRSYGELIKMRRGQSAFHPRAGQQVFFLDDRVFSIVRANKDTGEKIAALVNVSEETVRLSTEFRGRDLVGGQPIDRDIDLLPYQIVWVKLDA